MLTVWKYQLVPGNSNIMMPQEAKLLHCGSDGQSSACIWAGVETENILEERHISVYGTGHKQSRNPKRYVGSLEVESLFFHVYEEFPKTEL